MKTSRRRVVNGVVGLGVGGVLVVSMFFAPRVYWWGRTAGTLGRVTVGTEMHEIWVDGKTPAEGVWVLNFNTAEDRDTFLTNRQIGRVFDQAVADFSSKLHAAPVIVVRTDELGWERLCATWEVRKAGVGDAANGVMHVEVEAGSGNDNNYVHVYVGPQARPYATSRPGTRAMLAGMFAR